MATLILDKIDFRAKDITIGKERHYKMIKDNSLGRCFSFLGLL